MGNDQNIALYLNADIKSKEEAETIALVIPQPGQGMLNKVKKIHLAFNIYNTATIDMYKTVIRIFCFGDLILERKVVIDFFI